MNLLPATITTYTIVLIAFTCILIFKKITHADSRVSRKMTHILIGPIYILTWLNYPENEPYARYCAMSVVLMICISMLYTYLVKPKFLSHFLLETMSREGRMKELMEGPFIYGVMIVSLSIIYWKNTPHGMIPILILCLGDGMAEMIGMHGKHVIKAPFGKKQLKDHVLLLSVVWLFVFFLNIFSLEKCGLFKQLLFVVLVV